MGGIYSVTHGPDNAAFEIDSTYSIVTSMVVILVYEWLQRKRGSPVDLVETSTH